MPTHCNKTKDANSHNRKRSRYGPYTRLTKRKSQLSVKGGYGKKNLGGIGPAKTAKKPLSTRNATAQNYNPKNALTPIRMSTMPPTTSARVPKRSPSLRPRASTNRQQISVVNPIIPQ